MARMDFRETNEILWRGIRPAHHGTQVLETAKSAGGITTVIYTVPAGQVLYLTDWGLHVYRGAVSGYAYLYIYDSTPAVWRTLARLVQIPNSPPFTQALFYPVEIPAAYSIRMKGSANGATSVWCYIHGWVE